MRGIINVAFFFFVLVVLDEYINKGYVDLNNLFGKSSTVSIKSTPSSKKIDGYEKDNNHTTEHGTPKKYNIDEHVIVIRGLGYVDQGDLDYAADVIKDFYGYNVEFGSMTSIQPSMLGNNGELESLNTCVNLTNNQKTLYITDRLLYDEGILLRGVASTNNRTIIVRGEKRFMRETIIHEIGHTLGLEHCDDKTCVMGTHNDEYDSGDFCNKCKNEIVY